MRKLSITLLFVLIAAAASMRAQIVKINSSLDDIIPPDARVEKLTENPGTGALEGPVWNRKEGFLLFSDRDAKTISKWNPADGRISGFLNDSGSNGVTMDSQGKVVYCGTRDRQIVRLEEDGRRTALASQYEGKRLNGPNDLVYKSDGALYFTDNTLPPPPLGIADKDPTREISFNGVYLLKGGRVQLLFKDMLRPNGIALSADEKYLYVDDTLTKVIMRFEVQPDDTVTNGQVWFKIDSDLTYPYMPDGLKVDEKGNLYSSGPGGLWILSPGAKLLGIVLVPSLPNNLGFGDGDGKSLFMTTRGGLYRIRLKIQGVRP